METINILKPEDVFKNMQEYEKYIPDEKFILNTLIDDFNYKISKRAFNHIPSTDLKFTIELFCNANGDELGNKCMDEFILILKESGWDKVAKFHKWWSFVWRLNITVNNEAL